MPGIPGAAVPMWNSLTLGEARSACLDDVGAERERRCCTCTDGCNHLKNDAEHNTYPHPRKDLLHNGSIDSIDTRGPRRCAVCGRAGAGLWMGERAARPGSLDTATHWSQNLKSFVFCVLTTQVVGRYCGFTSVVPKSELFTVVLLNTRNKLFILYVDVFLATVKSVCSVAVRAPLQLSAYLQKACNCFN